MELTGVGTLAPPLLKPPDNTSVQQTLADLQQGNKEMNCIIHQWKAEQQTNNEKMLDILSALKHTFIGMQEKDSNK